MTRVAIIGAGISGLACARQLVKSGVSVVVFDKGRGIGGRVATRRAVHNTRFLSAHLTEIPREMILPLQKDNSPALLSQQPGD